jgi:hypothetical protein
MPRNYRDLSPVFHPLHRDPQFAEALHRVFLTGTLVSAAGLLAALFLPPVSFSHGVPAGTGEGMIEAEMTNLRPEDEPVAVSE